MVDSERPRCFPNRDLYAMICSRYISFLSLTCTTKANTGYHRCFVCRDVVLIAQMEPFGQILARHDSWHIKSLGSFYTESLASYFQNLVLHDGWLAHQLFLPASSCMRSQH